MHCSVAKYLLRSVVVVSMLVAAGNSLQLVADNPQVEGVGNFPQLAVGNSLQLAVGNSLLAFVGKFPFEVEGRREEVDGLDTVVC